MDQNLVFQDIHAFHSVKVHVYVYTPFGLLTRVYTLLCQGEPVYTSLSSFCEI